MRRGDFLLRDLQRGTFARALTTSAEGSDSSNECVWKVIVADEDSYSLLKVLFTDDQLRSYGVTLLTNILDARGELPDIPAVYVLRADVTSSAFKAFLQDVTSPKATYAPSSSVFAFLNSASTTVLTAIAAKISVANKPSRVLDLHCDYRCIEQRLFTLQLPSAYAHSQIHSSESQQRLLVERISKSLFDVIVTLRVIPVIRCARGGACEAIARTLCKLIRSSLSLLRSSASAAQRRPLLLLLERDIDLGIMLAHSWSYRSLLADSLGYKAPFVRVPSETPARGASSKPVLTRLDASSDSFWRLHAALPFPQLASAIETELDEYRKKVTAARNTSALAALPELSERKRVLDTHATLASALLNVIRTRKLDVLVTLYARIFGNDPRVYKDVVQILRELPKNDLGAQDALRLAGVYATAGEERSGMEVTELRSVLLERGADETALESIGLGKSRVLETAANGGGDEFSGIGTGNGAKLRGIMSSAVTSALHRGYKGLAAVAHGAKGLVEETRLRGAVANTLDVFTDSTARSRMGARAQHMLNDMICMDPRREEEEDDAEEFMGSMQTQQDSVETPEMIAMKKLKNMVYKDAIVFVVGGGNYAEYDQCVGNYEERVDGENRQGLNVLYGCTELLNAEQFLRNLRDAAQTRQI